MQARSTTTAVHLESATWRSAVLRWMDRWVDPSLLLLAALTVPILIVETGVPSRGDEQVLRAVNWAIWAAFTTNLVTRVAIAHDRARELRELVWDVAIVLGQPALLVFHVGFEAGAALLRVIVVVARALSRGTVLRRAFQKLARAPLRALAGIVPFLWLTSAALVLRTEAGRGSFDGITDALWWGAATLTTVGYGDVAPVDAAGRAVAVGTMITGIGMFSVVTAKLAEGLLVRRSSRSHNEVLDEGHLLVLGFSAKVFTIIDEMLVANDRRADPVVVILAEEDPATITSAIEAHVPALRQSNTRIEVRRGSPFEPADIELTRPDRASAVIVIDEDDEDASVVKATLALLNALGPGSSTPVVAEIDDPSTAAALRRTFPGRITVVEPTSFIARVAAQSCRAPGVALAYEELLSFRGAEFYVCQPRPEVIGLPFRDLAASFEDACLVGLRRHDGTILLNPPGQEVVGPDDDLVVVATDEEHITWLGVPTDPPPTLSPREVEREEERIGIFGWSSLAPAVIEELDRYLEPGTVVTVAVRERIRATVDRMLPRSLEAARIEVRSAPGSSHPALVEEVGRSIDHALILCDRDAPVADADARSLITMLQVRQAVGDRDAAGGRREHRTSIITELRDVRDVELAPRTSLADFIVSERLISLVLAQLAQNHGLAAVFEELLDADGSELYVKPVDRYVAVGEQVSFGQLARAVAGRDEVAVGYRRSADRQVAAANFGVRVNPRVDTLLLPEHDDQVLVIAAEPR